MGFITKRGNVDTSGVQEKHEELIGINKTVTEYVSLLEQVSEDRANLLLEISQLQLQNAELGVSKALYVPLENEINELREKVAEYAGAFEDVRRRAKELESCKRMLVNTEDELERNKRTHEEEIERIRREHEEQLTELRRELGTAKGTITRMKNRGGDAS